MKLEDQVCSFELARKLKELGVKQESVFVYDAVFGVNEEIEDWQLRFGSQFAYPDPESTIAAYTVAELGEMLPRQLPYKYSKIGYRSVWLEMGKTQGGDNGWWIRYADPHPANNYIHASTHGHTEADSRAKMIIYLLEKKFITL